MQLGDFLWIAKEKSGMSAALEFTVKVFEFFISIPTLYEELLYFSSSINIHHSHSHKKIIKLFIAFSILTLQVSGFSLILEFFWILEGRLLKTAWVSTLLGDQDFRKVKIPWPLGVKMMYHNWFVL